jgi:hypothetical protein
LYTRLPELNDSQLPICSIEGNVKRKSSSCELKQALGACIQPHPDRFAASVMIDRTHGFQPHPDERLCVLPSELTALQAAGYSNCRFSAFCFPSCPAESSQNGPELSRRADRRGGADLDSEDRSETMRQEGKQRPLWALCETGTSETDAVLLGNHGSISDSWPIALLGCPRGHRVNTETACLKARMTPTNGVDTHPRIQRFENTHDLQSSP